MVYDLDGDVKAEVVCKTADRTVDSNRIEKYISANKKAQTIFNPVNYVSNSGTKTFPGITCDIFGDWREKTIYFKTDSSAMAVFTTSEPTDYKIYALMHDLQYRNILQLRMIVLQLMSNLINRKGKKQIDPQKSENLIFVGLY